MKLRRFDVEFTKEAAPFKPAQTAALLAALPNVTDLFVVSHGWNNDLAEARKLYDDLLGNIEQHLGAAAGGTVGTALAKLSGRQFAVCQVFWPSKKFADSDLIPGGGSASAAPENDEALSRLLDELALEPERLGKKTVPAARKKLAARAKALAPLLETDQQARKEFLDILRRLLDSASASLEDGSAEFFSADSELLFQSLRAPVLASGPTSQGGATGVGGGGAAGIGDLLTGAKAAARRLANFATYYQMKSRAGVVGASGLAPLLNAIRARFPKLRLHLVGHSFGGRLVTAAAHALPDNSADITISLLQAAFSHNSLSQDFGNGKKGAFREVLSKARVSGPIVITHTRNDRAVGIAYPLASRIAHQNANFLVGGPDDPYGGMGRNGAQRTNEAAGNDKTLEAAGKKYGFAQKRVYNLLADKVINDHGDVAGPEVAFAVLSAAAAL